MSESPRSDLPAVFSLDTYVALLDRLYPRFVSQIDRDPHSPTYGCCDRGHWMYRLHDFDSGVLQQASLVFAALSQLSEVVDFAGCSHLDARHRECWDQLARAINRRTARLLERDGLLDEYYPGERSFPGTVFTSYALLKSALMLDDRELLECRGLRLTMENFISRAPSPAANQDIACAAFVALHSQTSQRDRSSAQRCVERWLSRPAQGGDFCEYGGADLGYATVTLNYLACMQADASYPVTDHLRQLAQLIAAFVSPAGRLGGEFASRSTTYFLPYGLVTAAYEDPQLAAAFAPIDLRGAYARLDDRYLMHYCLPSLALTALHLARRAEPPPQARPADGWQLHRLDRLGLISARQGPTALYVGLNKGGALQLEHRRETVVDCGYRLQRAGQVYASCIVDNDASDVELQDDDERLQIGVRVPFARYRTLTASPSKTLVLRLLRLFGPLLNMVFKRLLIKQAMPLRGVFLERKILLDRRRHTLTIDDRVVGHQDGDLLSRSPASSFRLVPSARFHQPGEEQTYLAALPPLARPSARCTYWIAPEAALELQPGDTPKR